MKSFNRRESLEIVDALTAEKWLRSSPGNRSVRADSVGQMSRDLAEGRWQDQMSEDMHFDTFNRLRNGHHRCHAILEASKSKPDIAILTRVIWGCSEEEIAAIDCGVRRTLGDRFSMTGNIPNANAAAAAVTALYRYAHPQSNARPSAQESFRIYDRHKDLLDESASKTARGLGIIGNGLVAAVHFAAITTYDRADAIDRFIQILRHGAEQGEPANEFRNRLIKAKMKGFALHYQEKAKGLVHAWHLYLRGETSKAFKIPERVVLKGITLELLLGEGVWISKVRRRLTLPTEEDFNHLSEN